MQYFGSQQQIMKSLIGHRPEVGLLGNPEAQALHSIRSRYWRDSRVLDSDGLLGHGPVLKNVDHTVRQQDVENLSDRPVKLADKPNGLRENHIIAVNVPMKDRSREKAWLKRHQYEYAGQWLALDGERLLSHGFDLQKVAAAAKQQGVQDALYVRAESPGSLPFAGF